MAIQVHECECNCIQMSVFPPMSSIENWLFRCELLIKLFKIERKNQVIYCE